MKHLTLSALFLALTVAHPAYTQSATPPPASATISMAAASVPAGQPVVLRVALKNISSAPLALLLAATGHAAEADYAIAILDAQGHAVRRLSDAKDGKRAPRFVKRAPYELPPGQTLEEDCDLAQFWDLQRPGTYTVHLSRPIPSDAKTPILSNPQIFTVTAP